MQAYWHTREAEYDDDGHEVRGKVNVVYVRHGTAEVVTFVCPTADIAYHTVELINAFAGDEALTPHQMQDHVSRVQRVCFYYALSYLWGDGEDADQTTRPYAPGPRKSKGT